MENYCILCIKLYTVYSVVVYTMPVLKSCAGEQKPCCRQVQFTAQDKKYHGSKGFQMVIGTTEFSTGRIFKPLFLPETL